MKYDGLVVVMCAALLLTTSTLYIFRKVGDKELQSTLLDKQVRQALWVDSSNKHDDHFFLQDTRMLALDVQKLSKQVIALQTNAISNSTFQKDNEDSFVNEGVWSKQDYRVSTKGYNISDVTEDNKQKQAAIRNAMIHAWKGYKQYAWGFDELQPISGAGKNTFGKLGATIVDAMDTLFIMQLTDAFQEAVDYVLHDMIIDRGGEVSVFETTIRSVGGLLSAYDLSGKSDLLRRAEELVQRLLPAFNTPTGLPYGMINLQTQKTHHQNWSSKASILSEFGSEQLEFFMLSYHTGQMVYKQLTENSIKIIHQKGKRGLPPVFWDTNTGEPRGKQVSFGALGDSYFEYLLKTWILTGKKADTYRQLWEASMDEMMSRLLYQSKATGLTYVAVISRSGQIQHKFEHLACFVPGMLALGVFHGAVDGEKSKKYLQVAQDLADTCYYMYKFTSTGLSPELILFNSEGEVQIDKRNTFYILRPEAVEAFFILWRVTGNSKYQDYGWHVFQAIERHCKQEIGYSGIKDINAIPVTPDDTMQTFFLAETLKYLYLLFSPNEIISLKEWVLNTEAHPLRIPTNYVWNQDFSNQ